MKRTVTLLLSVLMIAFCLCSCGKTETQPTSGSGKTDAPDTVQSEKAEGIGTHHVEIVVKDYGTIKLELDGNTAPITVQNFLDLADSGFYDGLTFHRIKAGFMMQGGSTDGLGYEGSDKKIKGEFAANGVKNNISHVAGVISMGRTNMDYNSASSQFFICHVDSTSLDGQYAAFGHVTEGMDIVDKICTDAKPVDNNGTIPADEQPVMEKVTVID